MGLNWSGAMEGLGQGLASYGKVMANDLEAKRDRDWRSQENKVMADRQTRLEELRYRNQLSAQKQQQEFDVESYGIAKEDALARDTMNREQDREDFAAKIRLQTKSALELKESEYGFDLKKLEESRKLKEDQWNLVEPEVIKRYGPEKAQMIKSANLYGLTFPDEKEAKKPTEPMWSAAKEAAQGLIDNELIKPEEFASVTRNIAYGFLIDPNGMSNYLQGKPASTGRYETEDAKKLADMSPRERADKLQQIRETEGEDVWQKAASDVNSILRAPTNSSLNLVDKAVNAAKQTGKALVDFGTRNVDKSEQDVDTSKMTPQQYYEYLVEQSKKNQVIKKPNKYGY